MTDTYLIQCAIFDDGDVLPTVVITTYDPDHDFLSSTLRQLREGAEEVYGRSAPDHALFWESLGRRP